MKNFNDIIYSDEQETFLVRVLDVIPVIQTYLDLTVKDVISVSREDVNSPVNDLYFKEQKPDALWWFRVSCASPEGVREALLKIALFERLLSVVDLDTSPKLVFFSESLRERAKEDIPPLTSEYIELLEQIVRQGYVLWKHANDYHAKDIPDLRDDLYAFYTRCKKVGYLLPDTEDGGPQSLGFRRVYLPSWKAQEPNQYITGENEEC
jgi:hypothetical protein